MPRVLLRHKIKLLRTGQGLAATAVQGRLLTAPWRNLWWAPCWGPRRVSWWFPSGRELGQAPFQAVSPFAFVQGSSRWALGLAVGPRFSP